MNSFEPLPFSFVSLRSPVYMDGAERRTLGGVIHNPVKQNRTHISALAEYLSMPEEAFSSYVVFSERCTLKKVPRYFDGDITVCRRHTMLRLMRKRIKDAPVVYSHADIERLAGLLRPLTEVTKEEKQQHIENLKTKCPFCGQPLVMRNGRNGAFWGCSSYPKCRYTRSLDGVLLAERKS